MASKFRELWRLSASPVTVVTTAIGNDLAGMTISSVTSLSLGPPRVLVSFNCQVPSRTARVLQMRNRLVLNMLSSHEDQAQLAKAFAGRTAEGHKLNPFAQYPEMFETKQETNGIPLVKHAWAQLFCDVHSVLSVQDHEIVVASVRDMWFDRTRSPLLYRNHAFCTTSDPL